MLSRTTNLYGLCHIETGRFLCAQRDGEDYVICFTDRSTAVELRDALGAVEHCAIVGQPLKAYSTANLYLDEHFVDGAAVGTDCLWA